MNLQLGATIARLRKEKGLTQEELATTLGVSNQAVSKWEAGKCYPDLEWIPALARLFGISIDALFAQKEEESSSAIDAPLDGELLQALRIAQEKQMLSVSVLQQVLNISYKKAKELIDELCARGYVIKDSAHRYRYRG